MNFHALPLSELRVVGRLSLHFLLDMLRLARNGESLTDTLITMAVLQANLAPVLQDQTLGRRYAETSPPDDLRRPISASAVALSLRIPYETVRRRIAGLAARGMCRITPKGVYVPHSFGHSPHAVAVLQDLQDCVRTHYERLQQANALPPLPPMERPLTVPGAPLVLVRRAASEYALRLVDEISLIFGDVIAGLVMFEIIRANTEHVPDAHRGGDRPGPNGFIPDEERRPVRMSEVAQRLGLPHETARRYALRLVRQEFCQRRPAGLVAPREVLARPTFIDLMASNHANLSRMFARLSRAGVIHTWAPRAGLA